MPNYSNRDNIIDESLAKSTAHIDDIAQFDRLLL